VNDLILIDTPAVNPGVDNKEHIQFVDEILRAAEADDIQLVLPATGSAEFLTETARQFAALQPTGVSLTHLDEAAGMSALYPFLQKNELPLHFVSVGQNIGSIETASPARLVCLI
jgi:flagellar biosynthesis GTPase FlhF